MVTFFHNISNLVTCSAGGSHTRTGNDMGSVGVIKNGAILFDEHIIAVGETDQLKEHYPDVVAGAEHVDCSGKTVLPGFVDSHTHLVFAGTRSHEFSRRLAGVPYTQIAAEGGGILTTMNAVREASAEQIAAQAANLALSALRHGTTTIEIKSGYGLSTKAELKLLEAAEMVRRQVPSEVHITFLGAHDVPPEYRKAQAPYTPDDYVAEIIETMLPAVVRQGYATACDVFTDKGFFTVEQSEKILRAARDLGLAIHVHADEIANIGASAMAARYNAYSADHLECISSENVVALAESGVVATLLPGTAYTLRLPPPPARMIIDSGAVVALATDCNPGSNYSENMQHVLSQACIMLHMSIEEAITAATLHGAHALRIANRKGSLEPGKDADIVVYSVREFTDIVYHYGINHVDSVFIGGRRVV